MKRVGILALQGDFERHREVISKLGCVVSLVRDVEGLSEIDAFIIPGGESTTIGRMLVRSDMLIPIQRRIDAGLPVLGTCAGLILLARQDSDPLQFRLSRLDIDVARNGYGRQTESFEAEFPIDGLDGRFRGVFIRAPVIKRVGGEISTLARFEGAPVLVRRNNILASSFHPELTDDARVHHMFVGMIDSRA